MPGPGRPFVKGQSRPPGSGRTAGTPNRFSQRLIDAIEASFEQLGGEAYLTELGRTEPRAYLALLGRILPAQVDARAVLDTPNAIAVRWAGDGLRKRPRSWSRWHGECFAWDRAEPGRTGAS